MASRDYYTRSQPQHQYLDQQQDGAVESSWPSTGPHYSDHQQSFYPPRPQLHPYSSRSDSNYTPYEERDAIQLDGRRKHESMTSVAPILVDTPADEDPFVRDTKERRRRSHGVRRRDGWFKGKVTWVCYVLSAAQLTVFIAEIIRNGEYE